MPRYIESFVLGFLIGCISLLIQVFIMLCADLFPTLHIALPYTTSLSASGILFTMLLIASIEEGVRFLLVYKKFDPRTAFFSTKILLIHGVFIGLGFVLCETFLALMNHAYDTQPLSLMIWPMLIHIILSICVAYISYTYHTQKLILFSTYISAILFHASANFVIFSLLN